MSRYEGNPPDITHLIGDFGAARAAGLVELPQFQCAACGRWEFYQKLGNRVLTEEKVTRNSVTLRVTYFCVPCTWARAKLANCGLLERPA